MFQKTKRQMKRMFSAVKNQGAFCNEQRLSVSKTSSLTPGKIVMVESSDCSLIKGVALRNDLIKEYQVKNFPLTNIKGMAKL